MTIVERVLLLQNIDLFTDVTTEQLSFIGATSEEISADSGTVLYREGDAPDGLYVVISGLVVATRGEETIERIGPNGSFGVWGLFNDQPRLTRTECVEPSQLLFVSREEFYEVLADHVDIAQAIFKQLVHRLRRLAAVIDK